MLFDRPRAIGLFALAGFVASLAICGVTPAVAAEPVADPFAGVAGRAPDRDVPLVPIVLAVDGSLRVDDDLVECPTAGYTTIQSAVDAAAALPGTQKIQVCAGSYAENVLIGAGNSLALVGAGAGSTIVTGVAGTAGPIIDVASAGTVDISRLTVDGGSAMAGGVVTGIRYDETDGRIKRVEVLNIRNADGSSQGLGIRVQSTSTAPTDVRIVRSLVENYTRVGIYGNGVGVDVTVKRNDVVGPVLPTVWAPNGVQISRGATARVVRNLVDNNPSPNPPGGSGSGIILFCPGPTKVLRNLVFDSDLGIALADTAEALVLRNDIVDSVFDGISLQFLGLFFGNIGCTAPGSPLPVERNGIRRNAIASSSDTGISLSNFDPATDPANPNDNRINLNAIVGSAIDGIHVFDGTDNLFKRNTIAASGSTDAVDDTSGGGTAGTANTWDANSCTTSSPAGLC